MRLQPYSEGFTSWTSPAMLLLPWVHFPHFRTVELTVECLARVVLTEVGPAPAFNPIGGLTFWMSPAVVVFMGYNFPSLSGLDFMVECLAWRGPG